MTKQVKDFYRQHSFVVFLTASVIISFLMTFVFYGFDMAYQWTDIRFHLARISGIVDGLEHGSLYPFVYFDAYPYGYGAGMFYPGLLLIPFCFLGLLGASSVFILQTVIFVVILGSIHSMRYAVSRLYGINGYLAGFLYVCFPCFFYRFLSCALGRLMVGAFMPLVILGVYRLVRSYKGLLFSFSMAACFYANPVSAVVICFFVSVFFTGSLIISFIRDFTKGIFLFKRLLLSALFTLGLSALAYLPIIGGMYLEGNDLFIKMIGPYKDIRAMCFFSLINDFLLSEKRAVFISLTGMVIGFFVLLLLMFLVPKLKVRGREWLILSLVFIYISSEFFPWIYLSSIVSSLEMPFRCLFMLDFCFVLFVTLNIEKLKPLVMSWCLACFGFMFMLPLIAAKGDLGLHLLNEQDVPDGLSSFVGVYGAAFEYVPRKYMDWELEKHNIKYEDIPQLYKFFETEGYDAGYDGGINVYRRADGTFFFFASYSGLYSLPFLYYPCYNITDSDGDLTVYSEGNRGFISAYLDSGLYEVRLKRTLWQNLGIAVSAFSFVTLVAILLFNRKKYYGGANENT